jgi:hypothetical protein
MNFKNPSRKIGGVCQKVKGFFFLLRRQPLRNPPFSMTFLTKVTIINFSIAVKSS